MAAKPKSKLSAAALRGALAILAFACAACGGAFGTANPTVPGNTSKISAETTLWMLGTPGTPFQAVVTDTAQSWTFKGVVPESAVIINNSPGVQMIATKLSNGGALLTTELISGTTLLSEASTNDPFGTTVVQSTGGLNSIAPNANPNIQVFVKGPSGGLFTGLVEDLTLSFVVEARSPALFLFEHPDGRVDAQISSLDHAGGVVADILSDGAVVVQASGGPTLLVKFP
jgi:hypothetical protein